MSLTLLQRVDRSAISSKVMQGFLVWTDQRSAWLQLQWLMLDSKRLYAAVGPDDQIQSILSARSNQEYCQLLSTCFLRKQHSPFSISAFLLGTPFMQLGHYSEQRVGSYYF